MVQGLGGVLSLRIARSHVVGLSPGIYSDPPGHRCPIEEGIFIQQSVCGSEYLQWGSVGPITDTVVPICDGILSTAATVVCPPRLASASGHKMIATQQSTGNLVNPKQLT